MEETGRRELIRRVQYLIISPKIKFDEPKVLLFSELINMLPSSVAPDIDPN
jgi:hypothetical protein